MTQNARSIIEKWYNRLGFPKEYDDQFNELLETQSFDENITLEDVTKNTENGKLNLLMSLYLLDETEKIYKQKDIPEEILLDTVYDFVRWTVIWSEIKGELCLYEMSWLYKHLTGKLIKIGRLQYVFGEFPKDFPEDNIVKGSNAMEVHIPADGPLNEADCQQSFSRATEFFQEYFPEYEYEYYTCGSWLLDKTLLKYMKPDSNIAKFQQMFDEKFTFEAYSILQYVFRWDANRDNLAQFEAKNSFAQKIKTAVMNGEKFYGAYGIRKK